MSFSSSLSNVFNHSLYEGQERSPAVCQCFFYVCAHAFIRRRRRAIRSPGRNRRYPFPIVVSCVRKRVWCSFKAGPRVPERERSDKEWSFNIFRTPFIPQSFCPSVCLLLTSFHQGPMAFRSQLLPLSLLPFLADKLTILTPIPPQAIYFSISVHGNRGKYWV